MVGWRWRWGWKGGGWFALKPGIAAKRNELRGVIIWCRAAVFLSRAAAGYQVDVGPLDVSISPFMRWCIPSRGARRCIYVIYTSACLLAALVRGSCRKKERMYALAEV